MTSDLCLFCEGIEKNYKPGPDIEYVCACCVQLLMCASREDRIKAYQKAISKGYISKAKAIEIFLPEGDMQSDVNETKKDRRNMVRKRPVCEARPARHEIRA